VHLTGVANYQISKRTSGQVWQKGPQKLNGKQILLGGLIGFYFRSYFF